MKLKDMREMSEEVDLKIAIHVLELTFGMSWSEICQTRRKENVDARRFIMAFMRHRLGWTLKKITKAFPGKDYGNSVYIDHSTVIHHINRHAELMMADLHYRKRNRQYLQRIDETLKPITPKGLVSCGPYTYPGLGGSQLVISDTPNLKG